MSRPECALELVGCVRLLLCPILSPTPARRPDCERTGSGLSDGSRVVLRVPSGPSPLDRLEPHGGERGVYRITAGNGDLNDHPLLHRVHPYGWSSYRHRAGSLDRALCGNRARRRRSVAMGERRDRAAHTFRPRKYLLATPSRSIIRNLTGLGGETVCTLHASLARSHRLCMLTVDGGRDTTRGSTEIWLVGQAV